VTDDVHVVGAAMIPMGRYREATYPGLAIPPVLDAIADAGLKRTDIETIYCGHSYGGMLVGQRIASQIGLGAIPVVNVENACSGGATALRLASVAVAQQECSVAVVVGIDRLSQFGGGTIPLVSEDWEVSRGMVMPALYAMRARRYLHERSVSIETLGRVSVKARSHGARNPYAQYRREVTLQEVLSSRMIADPLTLLQCCPTGDGAAALVLVSDEVKRRLGTPGIRIRSSVLHSGSFVGGFRPMLRPEITFNSANDAYEAAGVGPRDLDVVELHDAFTVAELVYYEALQLCEEGESAAMLESGASTYGGRTVVNPSGGLLAKGHPVGASGAAQVVEMFWQLTGRAGPRQVPGAQTGLTHVTGGGISGLDHGACAVHIFERS